MNPETHISNTQTGNDNTIVSIDTANNININVNGTAVNVKDVFENISVVLSNYRNFFGSHVHIDRDITHSLLDFCKQAIEDDKDKVAVVLGSAGMGKSVVMHDLLDELKKNDHIGVLAIKADRVVNSEGIAKDTISYSTPLIDLIRQYASTVERFVLLVDQIDALSQSMSNDRRAINYQDNLIQQVKQIPNSKIVVSCRPYDMQYDPTLEAYSKYKTFELTKLHETEVMKVLDDANIKHPSIGPNMMLFLQVPLHLYLYCLLNDGASFSENITLQKMYDKIWSEYIVKRPRGHGFDTDKIIEFLSTLSDEMFDKQSLFVNFRNYENKYNSEINYLSTNGVINIDDRIIQFFHQSFFDYVYARIFIESGKSLTNELNKAHQGLFIRQRVKQILTYEREVKEDDYAGHLKEIFYSGSSYRYHIKMLVLTTIGSYNEILLCEKKFINDYILQDNQLAKVFVESVYSRSWFQYFVKTNYAREGIRNVDIDKIKLIIELCGRLENKEPDVVLGYIDNVLCAVPNNTVKTNIARLIDRTNLKDFTDLIKSIYNKINDPDNGISMPNFLKIMTAIDLKFVVEELIKDIGRAIKKLEPKEFSSRLNVNYEIHKVYDQVSKINNDDWFDLLFAALNMLLERYEEDIKLHHGILRYSSAFLMYNRKEPYLDYFHYYLADSMFDLVEKQSVEDPDWLIPRLK